MEPAARTHAPHAVVTHVEYFTSRGATTWKSTLEYHDDAGNLLIRNVPGQLSQNQVLTILYDPDKPNKVVHYPVAGYEIGEPGSS